MSFLPPGLLGSLLPSIWNVLSWQPPCSASLPTIHLLTFYSDSTSSISNAYLSFFFFQKIFMSSSGNKELHKVLGILQETRQKVFALLWLSIQFQRKKQLYSWPINYKYGKYYKGEVVIQWVGESFSVLHDSSSSQYLSHFVITSCLSLFPTHVGKYIFHEWKV